MMEAKESDSVVDKTALNPQEKGQKNETKCKPKSKLLSLDSTTLKCDLCHEMIWGLGEYSKHLTEVHSKGQSKTAKVAGSNTDGAASAMTTSHESIKTSAIVKRVSLTDVSNSFSSMVSEEGGFMCSTNQEPPELTLVNPGVVCVVCDKTFKLASHLKQHVTMKHPEFSLICKACSDFTMFADEHSLTAHWQEEHYFVGEEYRGKVFCNMCCYPMKTQEQCKKHTLSHTETQMAELVCIICTASLASLLTFQTHMMECHGIDENDMSDTSSEVSRVSDDRSSEGYEYMLSENTDNNCVCPVCQVTCAPAPHLVEHIQWAHNYTRCPICLERSYSFDIVAHIIANHVRVSTKAAWGELTKDLTDISEPQSLALKGDLNTQKSLLHYEVAAFKKCCPECGAKFKSLSKFTQHTKIGCYQEVETINLGHSSVMNSALSLPSSEEISTLHKTKPTLDFSELTLPPSKTVPCPLCNKKFSNVDALGQHVQAHVKQATVAGSKICPLCGTDFSKPSELGLHVINHHSDADMSLALTTKNSKPLTMVENDSYTIAGMATNTMPTEHVKDAGLSKKTKGGEVKSPSDTGTESDSSVRTQTGHELKCPHCPSAFPTNEALEKHVKSVHKDLLFCGVCGAAFKQIDSLEQHKQSAHGHYTSGQSIPCNLCSSTFTALPHLLQHLESKHADVNITKSSSATSISADIVCQLCERTYVDFEALGQHLTSSHGSDKVDGLIPCLFCSNVFSHPAPLGSHIYKVHWRDQKNQGKAEMSNKAQMKQSTNGGKSTSSSYRCLKCSVVFGNSKLLYKHISTSHGKTGGSVHSSSGDSSSGNDVNCPLCKRSFVDFLALGQHISSTHKKESSTSDAMRCPICDKVFNHPIPLGMHVPRLHGDGAVGSVTCVHCGGKFKDDKLLADHIAFCHKHVGPKPISPGLLCPFCDKSLIDLDAFGQHVADIHGKGKKEGETVCPWCSKVFHHPAALGIHITSIHMAQPKPEVEEISSQVNSTHPPQKLVCSQCNKSFKSSGALDNHTRDKHGAGSSVSEQPPTQQQPVRQTQIYHCQICKIYYQTQADLSSHKRKKHPDDAINAVYDTVQMQNQSTTTVASGTGDNVGGFTETSHKECVTKKTGPLSWADVASQQPDAQSTRVIPANSSVDLPNHLIFCLKCMRTSCACHGLGVKFGCFNDDEKEQEKMIAPLSGTNELVASLPVADEIYSSDIEDSEVSTDVQAIDDRRGDCLAWLTHVVDTVADARETPELLVDSSHMADDEHDAIDNHKFISQLDKRFNQPETASITKPDVSVTTDTSGLEKDAPTKKKKSKTRRKKQKEKQKLLSQAHRSSSLSSLSSSVSQLSEIGQTSKRPSGAQHKLPSEPAADTEALNRVFSILVDHIKDYAGLEIGFYVLQPVDDIGYPGCEARWKLSLFLQGCSGFVEFSKRHNHILASVKSVLDELLETNSKEIEPGMIKKTYRPEPGSLLFDIEVSGGKKHCVAVALTMYISK